MRLKLNTLGASVTASSTIQCTPPLAAGCYAVWATTATCFITTVYSTGLTVVTGLPVPVGVAPALVDVGTNGQIFATCAAASSGVLSYMPVM